MKAKNIMKSKIVKCVVTLLLALTVLVPSFALPSEIYAATSAKSLLDKAAKKLDDAVSISYQSNSIRNMYDGNNSNNTYLGKRVGFVTADNKYKYGVYLDDSQSENGWEEYSIKDKRYRKSYSDSSWTSYTDSDYENDDPLGDTFKTELSYLLKNLKNPKIKSITSKYYVISGKLPKAFSSVKSVSITINKKTGRVTKVKYSIKKTTYTYFNSSDTYTVIGGSYTYSNISYGDTQVVIPDEISWL